MKRTCSQMSTPRFAKGISDWKSWLKENDTRKKLKSSGVIKSIIYDLYIGKYKCLKDLFFTLNFSKAKIKTLYNASKRNTYKNFNKM